MKANKLNTWYKNGMVELLQFDERNLPKNIEKFYCPCGYCVNSK